MCIFSPRVCLRARACMLARGTLSRAELGCLFSALQGQEMFTAVYLCCSPASRLWLAPFTRPQLQLQLNKTSNRDTRPFCLSFSPPSYEDDLSHSRGRRAEKQDALFCSLFPYFSTDSHLFISPNPTAWKIWFHLTSIYPPTRTSYPLREATLRVLLLLPRCLRLCFCRKTVLFMSRRPVAVCELKVVVSGLGPDHIRLKNIELFAFFSTLTMKQW